MKNARKYLAISLIIISLSFILFNSKKEYLSEDNILGVYVNNELSDNYPSKDSALFQKAVCDDFNTKVTWDNDNWGLLISNLNKKVKCNLYFYSGQTVFNFDYTGTEQTFVAPVSGTYKLETWGAQGGSIQNVLSGFGGYSIGSVHLLNNENLYIITGGQGEKLDISIETIAGTKGGYNGGGNGGTGIFYDKNYFGGSGGGGATSIQNKFVGDGQLKNYENFKSNILIVSGGGGGNTSACAGQSGSGGGIFGTISEKRDSGGNGNSGTQTSGYSFGTGQNGMTKTKWGNCGAEGNGGGGGGFYGGYSTQTLGDYSNDGAGGGSGYIGNPLLKDKAMYCYNCEESNEESTKTISTTCNEETPTSNCAKKGNGYARITLVSIDE